MALRDPQPPSRTTTEALRLATLALAAAGFVLGAVAAAGALSYQPRGRINAVAVLALLVGLPWLFLGLALLHALPSRLRRFVPWIGSEPEGGGLLQPARWALRALPQSTRERLDAAWGRGLATEAEFEKMTSSQIYKFIFAPGFSTAAQVTNVSGSGVGMDVVRTNIELIGGSIDVKSEEGRGSTFTIKIPLTLAIVSALIVECGLQRFAIPQISVLELVRASAHSEHAIEMISDAPVLRLRNRLLPLIKLRDLLNLHDVEEPESDEVIVEVIEHDEIEAEAVEEEVVAEPDHEQDVENEMEPEAAAAPAPAVSLSRVTLSTRSLTWTTLPPAKMPVILVSIKLFTTGPPVMGSSCTPAFSDSSFSGIRPTDVSRVSHPSVFSVPAIGSPFISILAMVTPSTLLMPWISVTVCSRKRGISKS